MKPTRGWQLRKVSRQLKSKVSRLRDWNLHVFNHLLSLKRHLVEIKSFSITRLKRTLPFPCRDGNKGRWNQKFLDYEIETTTLVASDERYSMLGWNQKFLDYEIETSAYLCRTQTYIQLKSKVSRLRDWNASATTQTTTPPSVEIKSFSITRLKLTSPCPERLSKFQLKSKVSRLRDWNNARLSASFSSVTGSWNQKFLDYEIETACLVATLAQSHIPLKSKVSRLRDWNIGQPNTGKTCSYVEIKSFSITRLKLKSVLSRLILFNMVEIKSFSITRLKHRQLRLL